MKGRQLLRKRRGGSGGAARQWRGPLGTCTGGGASGSRLHFSHSRPMAMPGCLRHMIRSG